MNDPHITTLALALFTSGLLAGCVPDEAPAGLPDVPRGMNPDAACEGKASGVACADDGNECTHDVCDGFGNCNVPKDQGQSCDDGDGNECTAGACTAGACKPQSVDDGEACDDGDGNECTAGACTAGACKPANVDDGLACDDGDDNDCTRGACAAGACDPTAEPQGTACAGPNGDNLCASDVCDGEGSCVAANAPAGTDCYDAAKMEACHEAACDGKGTCIEKNREVGSACKPNNPQICVAYSCQEYGNAGDVICQGTCDLGNECETHGIQGRCHEPAPGQCGCYGAQGACLGAVDAPVCFAGDACTGTAQCASGDTCAIDAPNGATGPWAFACSPCGAGGCPAEDFSKLLLVSLTEEHASVNDCAAAEAQGAPTVLASMREQLVAEARILCAAENVQVMALSDQTFSWQCGGFEGASPSTLYGEAAAFAICPE